MKTSSICYCRDHKSSKVLPGYCSTCYGTLPGTPESKINPSTLEELISLKSEFFESTYLKILKELKTSQSSSSPTLRDCQSHKRSNTASRLIKSKDKVPEEGPGINKINNLHIESHPSTRLIPLLTSGTVKSSALPKPKVFEISLQSINPISLSSLTSNHHDRASSSHIANSTNAPASWEKPQPAWSTSSQRANKPVFPSQASTFRFAGHLNSVNSLSFGQNRLFSCGSDYQLLAWPRIDPLYVAHNKTVSPSGSFKALSRPLRALCTCSKRLIVSAGDSEAIKLWRFSSNFECVQVLSSPDPRTKCLLAAGNQVLSAGSAGLVHVWDLEVRKIVRSHTAGCKRINTLIEFPNDLFVAGGSDGLASVIDFRCLRSVAKFPHPEDVNALICNEGQSFYSAADKFRVRFR